MSSNIHLPYINENGVVKDLILLCHPNDCSRITKKHLKKTPTLKPIMLDCIISTTDNHHWKEQKSHFIEGFIPYNLEKIIDISAMRASKCLELLKRNLDNDNTINISDFMLNETQAQLQLALFGSTPEFEKRTNKTLRDTVYEKGEEGCVTNFTFDMIIKSEHIKVH